MATQVSSKWNRTKISEVVELQQGLAINKKSKHLLVGKSNLALLRITDLINNKEEQFIDEELIPKQFIADEDSLIYSRTGQVGLVFKNREGVVHNNCFKIIYGKKLHKNFLFYFLKQQKVYDYVNQIAQKSAQPDLTHTAFKSLDIEYPDLKTQAQIADVLSAYDDLIENNNRRIKILEEMAQKIYTEWFVNFRFPGHEKMKFGKDGLPMGWKITILDVLVDNLRIPTKSGVHLINKKYVPINSIDSKTLSLKNYRSPQEAVSSLILFEKGDILFGAMRPYFHKVAVAPFSGVTRTTCFVLRSKFETAFVAMAFFQKETIEFATKNSQGATIPYINWTVLANKPFVLPSEDLIHKYSDTVSVMLEQAQCLSFQNDILEKSRDMLIPQLITGKRELK
jgi:type I restriction enzyme, S subunit